MQSLFSKIKNYYKSLFLMVLLAAAVLVWYVVYEESRSGLMVAFLDVGQGDAVFIQAENGNQVLLDGGPNKAVLRQLSKVMPFYDRSLDMIINSHPHADHLAGLIEVLERYDVDSAIESGTAQNTPEYQEWEKIIADKKIPHFYGKRGMKINLDKNLYLEILLPAVNAQNLDPHPGMLVAKLVYGNTSYLLTGDMEKPLENYLVSLERKNLKANVLKIGHHGSSKSTSESLLGFGTPQYAIISAGRDNSYGHPHKETLDILSKFEIQLLRTDEIGVIKTKSDGKNVRIVN
jgi:competence protein ComEC